MLFERVGCRSRLDREDFAGQPRVPYGAKLPMRMELDLRGQPCPASHQMLDSIRCVQVQKYLMRCLGLPEGK